MPVNGDDGKVIPTKTLGRKKSLKGCCGCCSALRPRYKRLVDNVFPVIPQDGLVKSNMDKLTFYALSSPEKLDRIGEYLYQKVSRDIYRRRNGLVVVGMEVMDQLLVACHAQTLNLFVESFLKIVQKLLESSEPQLQILATQSFVKFANIEEDTPSYHRRYDFFVSKFSSMCHNNSEDPEVRDQIRLAGIRGLQGVVRKTDSDDLVENIWESAHMDKIVPSLLFSMQQASHKLQGAETPDGPQEEKTDPPTLAENCLRELVGRASFGNIRSVLRPVLRHLDVHELWVPNTFAIHTFRIIMFSIQVQYSYAVVEILMSHLDENSKADPKIRTSIADVLSKIIAIAAGESVGPSVLEIVNSLLTHLWQSVLHSPSPSDAEACLHEKQYQDALINALGEYVNHLPDYHKIEIMMFIMGKVPLEALDLNHEKDSANALLQNMLLKSLLKVGTKYKTVHYTSAFPLSFLEPLLRTSLAPNPEVRLLVQQILHTMIDRHNNQSKLDKPTVDVSELGLTLEKCSLPDVLFIKKNGPEIYLSLFESLELSSNQQDNIEAVYTTMALLCVELACDETVMDLLRLVLSIQDIAVTSINMSVVQRIHLHDVVVSMLVLIPNVVPISPLMDYAVRIVAARRDKMPHLLPPLRAHYNTSDAITNLPPDVLVDQTQVIEALAAAGLDTSRLQTQHSGMPRHSWVDAHMQHMKGSVGDLNSFSVEVDSVSSSPGVQRKRPEEELTFDSLKKLLTEPPQARQEAEMERRMQISETFRTATFEDLMARTEVKNDVLQNKLNEIFGKMTSMSDPMRPTPTSEVMDSLKNSTPVQPYEIRFPELFVY